MGLEDLVLGEGTLGETIRYAGGKLNLELERHNSLSKLAKMLFALFPHLDPRLDTLVPLPLFMPPWALPIFLWRGW